MRCTCPSRFAPSRWAEPLVFTRLRAASGYEDAGLLAEDLRSGLPLLGPLTHTAGWRPWTEDTYRFPIFIRAFEVANHEYFMTCLKRSRVDPEWQTLLAEVFQEVQRGKMEGPFSGTRRGRGRWSQQPQWGSPASLSWRTHLRGQGFRRHAGGSGRPQEGQALQRLAEVIPQQRLGRGLARAQHHRSLHPDSLHGTQSGPSGLPLKPRSSRCVSLLSGTESSSCIHALALPADQRCGAIGHCLSAARHFGRIIDDLGGVCDSLHQSNHAWLVVYIRRPESRQCLKMHAEGHHRRKDFKEVNECSARAILGKQPWGDRAVAEGHKLPDPDHKTPAVRAVDAVTG